LLSLADSGQTNELTTCSPAVGANAFRIRPRARGSRDITVPIGISAMRAMPL